MIDRGGRGVGRLRAWALALTFLVGVPAGAQAPGAVDDPPLRQDVRLELWTIELERDFAPFLEESVAGFEAARPGTRVIRRDVTLGELEELLADAHASGAPPDLVNVNVPLASAFAKRGWLRDLEPSLDAEDRAHWFPGLLDAFRRDGRALAVPWYLTAPVLFYDPDVFERAGLDPDRPPGTTADMVEVARTLHARLDTPGIWPNLSGQQILYRFLEAGLPVTDDAGRRAAFATERHAAMLGNLAGLYADGIIPDDAFEENVGTPVTAFAAGRLPMVTANPSLLTRLAAENPDLHARVRVAPYPLGPGRTVHAPLMGLGVTAASPRPEAALELARYLAGDERQLAFARLAAILPSARGAASDPFFRDEGAAIEARARAVAAAQLPYARDLTMELPNASQLFQNVEREVVRAFLGYHAPIEALRRAARFWNALL